MGFKGTDGDDVFDGGSAADLIEGLGGDDRLAGGNGADTIIGGDGDDALFSDQQSTIPIYENDFSIILDDGGAHDVLSGGAGADLIFAGAGDSIDGGDGDDRLAISFKGALAPVVADFGALTHGTAMTIAGTWLTSIEELVWVRGSDFGDTLNFTGAVVATNIRIEGGGGDDRIVAPDSSGRVYGGDGDDVITAGYYAEGGDGDDRITAGARAYTVAFAGGAGADALTGSAGSDDLRGGSGADILSGGDGNDALFSGGTGFDFDGGFKERNEDPGLEKDWIDGGAGDDHAYIGYGDTADGGSGVDQLSISLAGATSGVTIDTTRIANGTATILGGTITGFESLDQLFGSAFGDRITSDATYVDGSDGNDLITATRKDQDLLGGAGDDRFLSNGLGDYIYGDAGYGVIGNDTVDYSRLTAGVYVTLGDLYSEFSSDISTVGTSSTGDTLREIENVAGTAFDDQLFGNASANHIQGNGGNDTIMGGRGADWLEGGDGNDVITINPTAVSIGDGRLSGGTGRDALVIAYPEYSSVDFSASKVSADFEVLRAAGVNVTIRVSQVQAMTDVRVTSLTLVGKGAVDFSAGSLSGDLYLSDLGNRATLETSGTNRVFGGHGADTVIGGAGADIVHGGDGNDAIDGGIGAAANSSRDQLFGDAGDDRLYGGRGGDVIDGGSGIDLMKGGMGNDLYSVDDARDNASEDLNAGTDTVVSSVSYVLRANVENLTLTGDARDGTGNALANVIIGTYRDNVLNGGGGADRLIGGYGDDTYVVDAGTKVVESLFEGTDTVRASGNFTLGDNIENLSLFGDARSGKGNALDNILTGSTGDDALAGLDGNDTIDGGVGNDRMGGGNGDDAYTVDSARDVVIEAANGGNDVVTADADFTLSDNVETLILVGTGHAGTGNALNNILTGSAGNDALAGLDGNDTIDGGAGADRMAGGNGDDAYTVDSSLDVVTETATGGNDVVTANADFALSDNVETLILTGSGHAGTGNAGVNVIRGGAGDDTLSGLGENDVLAGGAGNDTIIGGTGQDALFGEGGADRFVFAPGDTGATYQVADGIVDFSQGEGDRIDLSAFGPARFIGANAFSGHAGEVRFENFDGDTLVSIDTNGDRQADAVVGLIGAFYFNAGDFILG